MNVNVLRQFLHSLANPLRAIATGDSVAGQLERACQALEPFQSRDLGDFAEFLLRAQNYEREGQWPVFQPTISGELLDEPTAGDYAGRLRAYLQRRVPTGTAISEAVKTDLKTFEKRLTAPLMVDVAGQLGVPQPSHNKTQALDQIVQHLTGQSLTAKAKTSRAAVTVSQDRLNEIVEKLREVAGTPGAMPALDKLQADKKMTAPKLKLVADSLNLSVPAKAKKPALLQHIAAFLASKSDPTVSTPPAPPAHNDQIERFAEIVVALKAKADVPGSPTEEIEAELASLAQQLNRDDAVALVKRLGIVRPVSTRQEATEAIHRRVFEAKRARERIAF